MTTVQRIIKRKGTDVWSTRPDATVFEALELMAEKKIGALLVMDDDRLVGLFSERDYARKIILLRRRSQETQVSEIMTDKLHTVSADTTVSECMNLMTKHHIRHLPVMEDERVMGMLSIGDLVSSIIDEQQFTIQQLGSYISGAYQAIDD